MQPHAGGRVYLNFLGDEGAERVRQAYGDRQYERLVELKRAYEPDELLPADPEHRAVATARRPSAVAETMRA
jgi:berberine-like enzyme